MPRCCIVSTRPPLCRNLSTEEKFRSTFHRFFFFSSFTFSLLSFRRRGDVRIGWLSTIIVGPIDRKREGGEEVSAGGDTTNDNIDRGKSTSRSRLPTFPLCHVGSPSMRNAY